ncbi:MAG TPA: hypothetical protein DCG49_03235 [Ruminococcus sp.]|nr:hypothetical protein [Ruminococcus sp.]
MDFIVEKLIKVKKHILYHVPAYLLQSIKRSVSPFSGSVLIINHRLPAERLLLIAERNHTIIQMTKAFDCGLYHARNGTISEWNSTIIVFHLMQFELEISLANVSTLLHLYLQEHP